MSTPKRVPMQPTKMWAVVRPDGSVFSPLLEDDDKDTAIAIVKLNPTYCVQRVLVTAIPTKGRAK